MRPAPSRPVAVAAALVLAGAALALRPAIAGDDGRVEGTISLTRSSGKQVGSDADAVVYLVGFSQPPPKKVAVMTQKHEAFEPPVLAITRGQTVAFPNLDTKRHNVFSVSSARRFDLGLTPPGARPKVDFDRTGLVNVYCNIHPEMAGTILVLPNRAFAVTGPRGHYAISGIPPGQYTLYVWHPLADPIRRKVTITADHTLKLDLSLPLVRQHRRPHLNKYGRPYRKHPHY